MSTRQAPPHPGVQTKTLSATGPIPRIAQASTLAFLEPLAGDDTLVLPALAPDEKWNLLTTSGCCTITIQRHDFAATAATGEETFNDNDVSGALFNLVGTCVRGRGT